MKKNQTNNLFLLLISILFASCGTTKAVVSRPASGTTTTITITTNNPVTTDVSPDVDLNYKGKEQ